MKRISKLTIEIITLISAIFTIPCMAQKTNPGKPVVFNYNEEARPGEAVGLQGHSFGGDAEVWYAAIKGNEKALSPQAPLHVLSRSNTNVSAVLPEENAVPAGSLTVLWIKNGKEWSDPVFINRARVVTVEFEEIMDGTNFRVFGRNLFYAGQKSELVLYDPLKKQSLKTDLIHSDPFVLLAKAPQGMISGTKYSIQVSNGAGGEWGISTAEETLLARTAVPDHFGIGAPWGADFTFYKNVYNVKTDSRLKIKAKGDSVSNDRNAIQQAIDMASASGGGVVYLPAGKYRLDFATGSGLTMLSSVVLKGDGPRKTVIQYGYGTPPPYADPIGKGGWPDDTTSGVALLWPLGTQLSGLSDLGVQNLNVTGLWRHSLKTMRPKEREIAGAGSRFFAVNCHFDLAIAWGLSWAFVDKMIISDCNFVSYSQNTWPWLWHCDGSTNFAVRNNRIHYAAGRFGFSESFNGVIENNHITRFGDLQTFRGETGGFNIDYAKDIVIIKNRLDVDGIPIRASNQGETILSQGCNPGNQAMGTVTAATATTLTDSEKKWPVYKPRVLGSSRSVAIINGKGTGQWRYVKGIEGNTLVLERPWDIVPEKGCRYAFMTWSAEEWLVKDNVLEDNHQGIMFYCGCNDVMVEGNKLKNSGGIYLRSDQRSYEGRYNLIWSAAVENNEVIRTKGMRSAHINSMMAINNKTPLLGTGTLGLEIRRNLVQVKTPNATTMPGDGYLNEVRTLAPDASTNITAIQGTIFEKNTAVNCDYGYRVSKAVSQTIIKDAINVDVPAFMSDSTLKNETVVISEKENLNNDPFAPYLTGKAPRIVKELGKETSNGVVARKLIFHSYNYNKSDSATIFAAVVRPEKAGNYPGLLVLHGGGGFAEIEKAKKWAAKGYVVVALDEPGVAAPEKIPFSHGPWEKYKYGDNRFVTKPDISSGTVFSAVLASVQGLYLLHDQPDVIKDKVGVVGISWGGYLTTIVSGLANSMVAASFSVYGSGFYDDGSTFLKSLNTMKPEDRAVWLKYLDAGRRADAIKTPFFIAAAANDNWFYPPAVASTLKVIKGRVNHLFSPNTSHKIDLPGGTNAPAPDQPGWLSMEQVYFDYLLKGIGKPLPKISDMKTEKLPDGNVKVTFKVNATEAISAAQVSYSPAGVEWPKRKWITIPATTAQDGWYTAEVPAKEINAAFEWYATVSDARPVSVSSYLLWYE